MNFWHHSPSAIRAKGTTMITMTWLPQLERAGLEAVLRDWKAERETRGEPFHVLAFLAENDKHWVTELQQVCREHRLGLGGAVFPELLADGRGDAPGALLIRVSASPSPLLLPHVSDPSAVEATAQVVARHVETSLTPEQDAALFCIFDALVPNIGTHLDAWYRVLADRVSYFGVNAGSESFQPMACLFDDERLIGDGLLIQLLPDHPGACLNHDYGALDTHITATSAEGNRIVQIDWKPPLEVYRELMRSGYGVDISADNFYQYAVHYPFGIIRADGEVLVRIPVALAEDGSIYCVGEIPPNAVLTVLDAEGCVGHTPARMAADLKQQAIELAGEDLLLFYCAGRRMHLGERMPEELEAVQQATGARHVFGALSLGEIGGAHSGGYPLFHNATLVAVPCR